MSAVTEIETVVDRLTLTEQEELLRRLESRVGRRRSADACASRDDWMRRLSSLRASVGSGNPSLSGEQILSDLREE